MIKKLRMKFVLMIMVIAALLMSIILCLTFMLTKAKLETHNLQMMKNAALQSTREDALNAPIRDGYLPYFVLKLIPNESPTLIGSDYYTRSELEQEDYLTELADSALAMGTRNGVLDEHNLRFCRVDTHNGYLLVFSDISSEKAALEELLQSCILLGIAGLFAFLGISILLSRWAVKPVDDAIQQQRRFIADASHELKTPLTVLMTNAQLLQSGTIGPTVQKRCLNGMLTMCQQMKSLIEEMLDLARMDIYEDKLCTSPVNLSHLVYDTVLYFEPVFFERGMKLHADGIQSDLWICGDESRLCRMLEILLDNAQKYASPGTNTWVTLQGKGMGRCLLAVSNQGDSIAPQDLSLLFQRFYRADQARSRQGSFGLGLSIAQKTAELHKGRIWAESKNGINTFFVEFPGTQSPGTHSHSKGSARKKFCCKSFAER